MVDGVTSELGDTMGGRDGVESDTAAQMEAATGMPSLLAPCLMEFTGCFIFIYTICMAVVNAGATNLAPIGIGGCLMVLIYTGGAVSGGHFNPAVSLGIFIRDDNFSVMQMGVYMLAQFLGGILGGIVAYLIYPADDGNWGAKIEPGMVGGEDYSDGAAFLNELIYAFLLVFTVLNVATSPAKAYQNNSFFALAIGFSVVAGAIAGGGISGGAYNPAVAFGVTTASSMANGDFEKIWIPLLGDFLGGALAGVFYRFICDPHLRANM